MHISRLVILLPDMLGKEIARNVNLRLKYQVKMATSQLPTCKIMFL